MKKNLVLFFALAFMGSSLSIPAFAAVKSGAVCKNQGQVKTVTVRNSTRYILEESPYLVQLIKVEILNRLQSSAKNYIMRTRSQIEIKMGLRAKNETRLISTRFQLSSF